MDGYARTEDELFSSCLLNLTWENCYEQLNMERYRKVATEVEAIDRIIGKEYKSERMPAKPMELPFHPTPASPYNNFWIKPPL